MTGGISRAGTLLIAALAALVLVSPALAKDGQAEVRVAHLAPDAPDADVYVDGEPVSELTDVPYGIVSAYLPLSPGSHSIQIYASKDAARPMVEADAEFQGGTAYTVGIVGSTDDGAPTAEIYRDDNSIPPEGRAKLRVVNTSPDAGSVNVVPEGEGEKLVSDLEFPNASDYAEVPSGTSPDVSDYDVVTKAKGIEPWPLPMPYTSLKSGTAYSAFVVGNSAAENFQVVVTVDNSTVAIRDTAMALPDTGGLALLPIATGLAAVGIGGLLLKRRLS